MCVLSKGVTTESGPGAGPASPLPPVRPPPVPPPAPLPPPPVGGPPAPPPVPGCSGLPHEGREARRSAPESAAENAENEGKRIRPRWHGGPPASTRHSQSKRE